MPRMTKDEAGEKKMKEREKSRCLTGKFRLNFEGNRENLEYLRTLRSAIDFYSPLAINFWKRHLLWAPLPATWLVLQYHGWLAWGI